MEIGKNTNVKLFPSEYFNKNISSLQYDGEEVAPIFKLPIGFHGISLFYISQFYSKTDEIFFQHYIFDDQISPINGKEKLLDFSQYFDKIIDTLMGAYGISNDQKLNFMMEYTDRAPNLFQNLLTMNNQILSQIVPHGKEQGISYYLTATRNIDQCFAFLLDCNVDKIPQSVITTHAQPLLFSEVVAEEFPLASSVKNKPKLAKEKIEQIENGSFNLVYAIVSIGGVYASIILRPPQYIRISDHSSLAFNSVADAFEDSRIIVAVYQHTKFQKLPSLDCVRHATLFHENPIPSDNYYLSIIKYQSNHLSDTLDTLSHFISNCMQFPAAYFKAEGLSENAIISASIALHYPGREATASKITETIIGDRIPFDTMADAVNDYNRLMLWTRSFTEAIESFTKSDSDNVGKALRNCFYALPVRCPILINATIDLTIHTMTAFHKRRGMNDKLHEFLLLLLRYCLGENFDRQVGLHKYDLYKSVRQCVVTFDTCSEIFRPCDYEPFSIRKAYTLLIQAIDHFSSVSQKNIYVKSSEYDFDPEYLNYLTFQIIRKTVEQ